MIFVDKRLYADTLPRIGTPTAFNPSNRLRKVSGTTGPRINVTGTFGGAGVTSVKVTPNNLPAKMVETDYVKDSLWVARGVELQDSSANTVAAIGYDDDNNTDTVEHTSISLDDDVLKYYSYDSTGKMTGVGDGANTTAYTYHKTGLLKKVTLSNNDYEEYYYDGLGRRP